MCTPPKSMVSGKKTSADRCIRGLQYEVGRKDIWQILGGGVLDLLCCCTLWSVARAVNRS
jgi:hypothetical protein